MSTQKGRLFIVSGPSGVGKTTVVNRFLLEYGKRHNIHRVVTYTTKVPRLTEQHGVDYYFIDQSEFDFKKNEGQFLESSGQYGASYATPIEVLQGLESGMSYILVIDRVGAAQILQQHAQAVLIWIYIESIQELTARLMGRNTESLEAIKHRLTLACDEMLQEELHAIYHYRLMNDDVKCCVERLSEIILPACKLV